MRRRIFILLFSALLYSGSVVFAQNQSASTNVTAQPVDSTADADAAKKKKEIDDQVVLMLNQSVGDANTLRLPQNKAIVFGISGDLYWKFDEKRARELFRSAA